jgi:hypothetical protein
LQVIQPVYKCNLLKCTIPNWIPKIYLLGNLIDESEFLSTETDSSSVASSTQALVYNTAAKRRMK